MLSDGYLESKMWDVSHSGHATLNEADEDDCRVTASEGSPIQENIGVNLPVEATSNIPIGTVRSYCNRVTTLNVQH